MGDLIRKFAVALILMVGVVGCSDNDNALKITGPEVSQGPGRVYPITQVNFASNDGIQVSALFGVRSGSRDLPVVILLHDLGGDKNDWLSGTGAFVELLERDYAGFGYRSARPWQYALARGSTGAAVGRPGK